jgi:hypothetical protein
MGRLAWLLALVAGCDHLLQLEDVKPMHDGHVDSNVCMSNPNVIMDRFDGMAACAPWGSTFGNANVIDSGLELVITGSSTTARSTRSSHRSRTSQRECDSGG